MTPILAAELKIKIPDTERGAGKLGGDRSPPGLLPRLSMSGISFFGFVARMGVVVMRLPKCKQVVNFSAARQQTLVVKLVAEVDNLFVPARLEYPARVTRETTPPWDRTGCAFVHVDSYSNLSTSSTSITHNDILMAFSLSRKWVTMTPILQTVISDTSDVSKRTRETKVTPPG